MFVLSKRNLLLPSADGAEVFKVRRGWMGEVPDWAAQTDYFRALLRDGKLIPTQTTDRALQQAAEKPVKKRGTAEAKE